MIKRLTIAAATAAAMLFAAPLAANASGPVHPVGTVHVNACPSPLTAHPDGTCWP